MKFLVLSDIHAMSRDMVKAGNHYSGDTGSTHFAEDRSRLNNRILAISDTLRDKAGQIDALFILGDLAHQAKQLVISQVWNDANALANELKIPNVIGLIGHHDIYSRAKTLKEAEDLREFLKSIEPKFPVTDDATFRDYYADSVSSFAIGDCRIIMLNTCDLHGIGADEASVKKLFERGNISVRMIEKVNAIYSDSKETHFIVAMHHHPRKLPVPADKFNDVMDRGELLLSKIASHKKSTIILHGHKHLVSIDNVTSDIQSPVLFSAASLAAEPYFGQAKYFSNQFHLFELDIKSTAHAKGKVFSWDWCDPNWEESTRPHMPFEKPFGMTSDFKSIQAKLVKLPKRSRDGVLNFGSIASSRRYFLMVLRDSPVRRAISRIGILSRNAQRLMTLKNPMSITPNPPEQKRQGYVFTWVSSQ